MEEEEDASMAISNSNVLRLPVPGADGAWRIGTNVPSGGEVCISRTARQQGLIHIVGVSGSGKTTIKLNLINQALQADEGLALIEPAGDLTRAVIATMPEKRVRDVVLLNLMDCGEEPFGLNIFQAPEPRSVTEVAKTASHVYHIFAKAWGIGPQTPNLGMVLRHVTRTLIDSRASFAEVRLLLEDPAARQAMVKNVTSSNTRQFWASYNRLSDREKRDQAASFLNKCDAYLQEGIGNILSQERSTIDFRTILDSNTVLLVLLSPQLSEMSRLIGSMVIAGILRAAYSRADTPEEKRRPFSLFIDEFQHFLTEDTAVMVHESRKWGLSPVVLGHQTLEQLDEANRAAVAGASIRMVCRVSPEDAKALAPGFDTTPTRREVIGEEPVRAPVADVISHLVHKGHQNPVVADFTAEYVLALEGLIRTMGSAMHPMELGRAMFGLAHAVSGRGQLNDVLSACQRSGRADLFIPPMALFMLGAASSATSIPVVFENRLKSSGGLFIRFHDSADELGQPGFLTDGEGLKRFLARYATRRFWDSLLSSHVVTPGPDFVHMLRCLREVMAILAHAPLMSDTGLFQPKYQTRTYADQEHEIANFLSTQPNYQARVRFVSSEHVIRTHPAPQGLSGELLDARLRRITRQMRVLGYTRSAAAVEEEVAKRHEQLRGSGSSDDPPPTHD
jgi:hypothetical protein